MNGCIHQPPPATAIIVADGETSTFTAPGAAAVLIFTLTVTDDSGDSATNTGEDTVTITVTAPVATNQPPVADAGDAQEVDTGVEVTLTGSASSDSDGTIQSYAWTHTSTDDAAPATVIPLTNADTATATFTAPDTAAVLVFTLTVTDDADTPISHSDTVTITVTAPVPTNTAPVATFGAFAAGIETGTQQMVRLNFDEAVTGLEASDFSGTGSINISLDDLDDGDATTYSIGFVPTATAFTLTLAANSVADLAGLAGPATAQSASGTATQADRTTDSVAPFAEFYNIETGEPFFDGITEVGKVDEQQMVGLRFSEAVTGLARRDFRLSDAVANGARVIGGGVSGTGTTYTITFIPLATTFTLFLDANSVTDTSTNANQGPTSVVSVSGTATPPPPTELTAEFGAFSRVTTVGEKGGFAFLTFSEDVAGLDEGSFSGSAGLTIDRVHSFNATTYQIDITPTEETFTLTLDANSVTITSRDPDTGPAEPVSIVGTAGSRVVPLLAFTADGQPEFTNDGANPDYATDGDTLSLTFSVNQPLASDPTVTIAGQTVTAAKNVGDGNDYTATYTVVAAQVMGLDGTLVSYDIGAMAAFFEPANTLDPEATESAIRIDITAPSVTTFITPDANGVLDAQQTHDITFSEPVTGLDSTTLATVITTTGGVTVDSVTDTNSDQTTYTIAFTPTAAAFSLTLAANSVTDLAGHTGPASEVTVSGTATLVVTATFADITGAIIGQRSEVNLTFSEGVTGLEQTDFSTRGATVTGLDDFGDDFYTVSFTPTAASFRLTLAANSVIIISSGEVGPAESVFIDATAEELVLAFTADPELTSSNPGNFATVGDILTLTFSVNQALGNTPEPDIAGAGRIPATKGDGNDYSATWTVTEAVASANDGALVFFSIGRLFAVGSVRNRLSVFVTDSDIRFDHTPPSPTFGALAAGVIGTAQDHDITFNEAITALTDTDFATSIGATVSSVALNTDPSAEPNTYTITFTPSATEFTITLAANAVSDLAGLTGPATAASASGSATQPTATTADLSSLTTTAGALSPIFNVAVTNYNVGVLNGVTSTTITPTAIAGATLTVAGTAVTSGTPSGDIPLIVGANAIAIVVTAADGTTEKTYTVTVRRAPLPVTLTLVADTGSSLTDRITSNGQVEVTGLATNAIWRYTINGGSTFTPGTGTSFTLPEGDYTADADDEDIQVVQSVSGADSVPASLAAVTVDTTAPVITLENDTVAGNTGVVGTAYTDPGATAMDNVDTSVDVVLGGDTLDINTVAGTYLITYDATDTAGNGAVQVERTVTVVPVPLSMDADLSSLTISEGTLPTFAAATTSYAVNVDNDVTSVTLMPSTADAAASVTVAGTAVTSGATSGAITLDVGVNAIAIVVTAEDGTTMKTYTVTVTRAANTAPELSGNTSPSVAENTPITTAVATYTATDAESNIVTLALGGTDVSSFDLDATSGVLTFRALPDYETKSTYAVTVQATETDGDPSNLTGELAVTITVTNEEEEGAIGPITGAVQVGRKLTAGEVTDPDGSVVVTGHAWQDAADDSAISGATDAATYTLVADDAGKTIQVVATYTDAFDDNEKSVTSAATVAVVAAAPPATPSLALARDTGRSRSDGITQNGQVNVAGLVPDATWRYSTNGGTDFTDGTDTSFTLPEGVYAAGVVQVVQTVSGTDSATGILRAVTVDTTAPVITLENDTVAGNTGVVGTAYTDPGATAMDNVDTSVDVVLGGETLDINTIAGTYLITYDATDTAGNEAEQVTRTVTVNPVSTDANLSGLTITEGALSPPFDAATISYAVSADNDVASVTLMPSTADAAASVTVAGTAVTSGATSGAITLDVGVNAIAIVVTAEDGTTMKTYTVTVTRADNTAPVIDADHQAVNHPENTPITTIVATYAATDTESNTITWGLTGTDAGLFTINPTSGALTFNSSPDYETKSTYAVTVQATETDGDPSNLTGELAVTITVTNVDEEGVIAAITGTAQVGQTLTAGEVTDPDGSVVVTGLMHGKTGRRSAISGATGMTYTLGR